MSWAEGPSTLCWPGNKVLPNFEATLTLVISIWTYNVQYGPIVESTFTPRLCDMKTGKRWPSLLYPMWRSVSLSNLSSEFSSKKTLTLNDDSMHQLVSGEINVTFIVTNPSFDFTGQYLQQNFRSILIRVSLLTDDWKNSSEKWRPAL